MRVNRPARRAIDLARPAVDRDALIRFVGGRARVNAVRRCRALLRQADLLGLLLTLPLGAWPAQRLLADHLGVSQQTISRDLRAIMKAGAIESDRRARMRVGTLTSGESEGRR